MTSVHPIHFSHEETISRYNDKTSHGDAKQAINNEREEHIRKAKQRSEVFENILRNSYKLQDPIKHVLSGIAGILLAMIAASVYTLVPVHNLIEQPEYWYEWLLQFCLSFLRHSFIKTRLNDVVNSSL